MKRIILRASLLCGVVVAACPAAESESGLAAHWPLLGNADDVTANANNGKNHDADLGDDGAKFDGRTDRIEVADSPSLAVGTGPFSVAVWVHTDEQLDDVVGDVVSKYDSAARKGFSLGTLNAPGVGSAQSNYRNVCFGIDDARTEPAWTDCGRPGKAVCVWALTVFGGNLYAGTFENGADEAGHVYRYAGGSRWEDCGSPDASNAVMALAVYQGHLYAGTARYNATGSALAASPNDKPGGKVYRYEGGTKWTCCGRLENPESGPADTVESLTVYRGKLYAAPIYKPGLGLYEYAGGQTWKYCGNPGRRVNCLGVHNGSIYATSYDNGPVARYDATGRWTDLGTPPDTTQTYAFMTYEGELHVSTWPNAIVFKLAGADRWVNQGRLGAELEVMGMAVYNGKLYGGTLPLAEVYRYDGGTTWTSTGRLDTTPDVKYRRVWSMAVFQGRLFAGTLPSGHVYSFEAGKSVTYDHELGSGWRHLAAVRDMDRLRLYVDGTLVATSVPLTAQEYDLTNGKPLRIGFGPHDCFNGRMKDLRLYRRALTDADVSALFKEKAKK